MDNIFKKVLFTFLLLYSFSSLTAHAQQVLLDHSWYLAGEKMTIAVEVSTAETASKVAYIEICDANGLQANAVIDLVEGRGQGCIYLPTSLHSGYYQLSMYTRLGDQAMQMMIPVINTLQKSTADDIDWMETASKSSFASTNGSEKTSLSATINSLPSTYVSTFGQRAEIEGHCVYARIRPFADTQSYRTSLVDATLAVVGKEVHVFQGKMLDDSTAVFNTYDINGRHSVVLAAETNNAQPLQVEILNPFATLLPKELPHLTFNYNRAEVEKRSVQMQLAANDTMSVDSTVVSDEVFSTKPLAAYNLDEYRQFHTIREVLLEYISFVHRSQKNGRNHLYVYNDIEGYSDWSAMVLLDGMPVKDIDRLLKYDARRVHYIFIYDDYYTFGNIMYKGMINIITRTGKLTNFPPEKTSAFLIYDFPQK